VKEFHVLNLGAGVQSTALYLMFSEGMIRFNGERVALDAAIFADTQDEPKAVYRHLEWLQQQSGPLILVRSKGRISEHLLRGENSTGGRFASIPAYTLTNGEDGKEGRTRRQCSKEYKIDVIERAIREEIIGVKRGQRVPKDVVVHQYIGISLDEAGRAMRISANQKHKWVNVHFPLIEQLFFTRPLCLQYLDTRVPHKVPRSACVYCPFHDDNEWLAIQAVPEDWALAVEVDEGLRTSGAVANRKMDCAMYVHRSCKPLVQIEFKPKDDPRARQLPMNFNRECMGVCGV
jgi:hypothetical protein